MKQFILSLLLLPGLSAIAQTVDLVSFATGLDSPIEIVNAGDSRLFVLEQPGVIQIVNSNGSVNATPFLDIQSIVEDDDNEEGLLGLAFHPNYSSNGLFYVNYINNSGNSVVARYQVSADADIANAASETILFTVNQPFWNHNGGHLAFGPDGYLYIGFGDGGSSGDPGNRSQDPANMLGKMLRIDVDSGTPYGIPSDNPFLTDNDTLNEIWAIGVRNPWKFSFDAQTGDLWIADVGQNAIEEINHVTNGTGGLNYGWRCYEGNSTYNTSGCPAMGTLTFPVAQYNQGGNPYKCSITGGYVYRGSEFPNFVGKYFFSDYCSSQIGIVDPANGNALSWTSAFAGNFTSFGEDVNGEIYVAAISNGTIYKLTDSSVGIKETENGVTYSVYPNPAANEFNIVLENQIISNLTLVDNTGRLLMNENEINTSSTKVNTSRFATGIYYLTVTTLEGVVVKDKITIQ